MLNRVGIDAVSRDVIRASQGPMKIGLILPQWTGAMEGQTPQAPGVASFARVVEEMGLDSLWLTDQNYYEPYLV
jgi:hypothetical protein